MDLLTRLRHNKGTVSSALGKELAQKALKEDESILQKAIELSSFEQANKKEKAVRAGAAKVVEIVAEKQPELVAPYLENLLPALEVSEPQTRWMIIRTMGFCAHLNPKIAEKAIPFAEAYIKKKEGLCITSSADLFLGDYGAISARHAKKVFPLLEESISTVIPNESDWILETIYKLFENLDSDEQEIALSFARINLESERKSTQKRAAKILKLSSK